MTRIDKERISLLNNHPGFTALLKMLDEADEILLEKLETAPKEKENDILPLWRASRRFKKLIKDSPAEFYEELGGTFDPF